MNDFPRKKKIWAVISVYICLYLAAFVCITSTDLSRFVHTHISYISVYIACISYELPVASNAENRGGSPIHTGTDTGHNRPDLGYKL